MYICAEFLAIFFGGEFKREELLIVSFGQESINKRSFVWKTNTTLGSFQYEKNIWTLLILHYE